MALRTVRRRMRRVRRQTRFWDGVSVGSIAVLAGVTLILVSLAMRHG